MSNENGVTLTVNGRSVKAEKGRLLIDVCEELGIFVPRFCYHPGMKSVAVCRMCLVKVEGQKKLMPSCATPVDDGMNVETAAADAVDAQEGMLEFLLINHPLDCPICDRGGECPLQDQTYKHGPGSSRYVEPKRTFEKALEISDLVVLDRERCVLCWRCVRFADEIAGDQFIQLVDRGPGTQILTFKDEPFDSYFSGNTIQICPVGALTAKPYRFVSRPWNLKTAPSVCGYCSVGCPITNEARADKLVRCQALPNENVNDFWICDKGRFGYHYVDSPDRLQAPLVRSGDEFEPATWGQAMEVVAEKLKDKEKVGIICGGHLTTEDAFAISRLGRKVMGIGDIDSRVQDAGAPYELAIEVAGAAGSSATLNDLENARTIVWAGPDPKETLPVLYLRLRKAVLDNKARLIVLGSRRISLDAFATEVVRSEPGGETDALSALDLEGEGLVACWGPASPGRDESAIARALVTLVKDKSGKLLVCPPHAGSQGLIDMGVFPSLRAGYDPVAEPGKDTRAILEAAAAGELDALLIFGADVIADFPDADLARRALQGNAFTIVFELFPTETATHADVVLPAAAYAEREGTFTNMERRLQKLEPLDAPPGSAVEGWRAAAAIARALGDDWGWKSFDHVWSAIHSEVPTHKDVDVAELSQETPPQTLDYESGFETPMSAHTLAGPGGQYPKGHRSGAPFQTGQNWPLSWELRAFEARQRPGLIPSASSEADSGAGPEPAADGSGSGPAAGGAGPSSSETVKPTSSSGPAPSSRGGSVPSSRDDSSGTGAPSPPQDSDDRGAAGPSGDDSSPSFVLLTGRMIYDEGSMVARSAALRGLARRPFVEVCEEDVKRLEVSEGDEVVVSAGDFETRLPIVVADIASGAVFVPYDQPGLRANELIRGVDPMVEVRRP